MAGKRYAILIASSKYPDEPGLAPLRCPENDVDALNEVLSSPDFGQFAETFVFKNKPSHEVLEKIETVLHDAGREDLVLIYFSGHGKLNASNQLCLATVNTKLKALGSTAIPIERIKSFFDAADTRKKILILDCCNSGMAGEAFTSTKGSITDQLQLMSQGQGTFIMTASARFQEAEEKPGDSLGLFTKHLVEGIRSGEADKDEDGLVDIHELYQHVHEKVRSEGKQEPMKWDLHAKGKMIVAKSGRESKEKHKQELRTKLYALAGQGLLTDSIVREALHVIILPDKEMTEKDKTCFLLIEQLTDDRISYAGFVESWVKTCLVDKQKADTDSPDSKNNLWNWLIYDVFADLILRAVLVGFIGALGWLGLKQWQSRPDVKPIASSASEAKKVSLPPSVQPKPAAPVAPSVLSNADHPQNGRKIGQYIDHGDGTITDTKSGLMWKRCLEGLSGVNCEKGETRKYQWYKEVQRFKNVKYAGYSDWRMPTLAELKTLVYCSNGVKDKDNGVCNDGSEKPTINQQAFPNNEALVVWSGSPYAADNSDFAWHVGFYHGVSDFSGRGSSFAVRLVRGGQ